MATSPWTEAVRAIQEPWFIDGLQDLLHPFLYDFILEVANTQRAFRDALRRTSTEDAPWYVVPGDRKWVRNLVVAKVLRHHLERIGPAFPPIADDVAGFVVPPIE